MLYLLLSRCHLTVVGRACVASRCLHSLLSDSRSRPKYTPCLASRVPLWYFYDIMYSIWTKKEFVIYIYLSTFASTWYHV